MDELQIYNKSNPTVADTLSRSNKRKASSSTSASQERPQAKSSVRQAVEKVRGQSQIKSNVIPLLAEFDNYCDYMEKEVTSKAASGDIVDPLYFWAHDGTSDFPILARIAGQVFAADATSGETERIGSTGGIYYSPRRNKLKPATVKKMIFLHGCYLSELAPSKRSITAKKRVDHFIRKQSISCFNCRDGTDADFEEFLNSLCAWIYYDGEDEESSDDEVLDDSASIDYEDSPDNSDTGSLNNDDDN